MSDDITMLELELAQSEAITERITRKLLFVELEAIGVDPVSPLGLKTIDTYRPDVGDGTTDEIDQVFSREAIQQWVEVNA